MIRRGKESKVPNCRQHVTEGGNGADSFGNGPERQEEKFFPDEKQLLMG